MGAYLSDEEPIKLLSEHTEFSDEQRKVLEHKGGCCIVATAGAGKALSNGSKVLCYDENGNFGAYFKSIEDMKVGDCVQTISCGTSKVVGVFPQGKKKEYLVTFNDGTEVKCCIEHLWSLIETEDDDLTYVGNNIKWCKACNGECRVVTTKDIINMLENGEEAEIPVMGTMSTFNMRSYVDRKGELECLAYDMVEFIDGIVVLRNCKNSALRIMELARSLGFICKYSELGNGTVEIYNSIITDMDILGYTPKRIKKTIVSVKETGKEVEMTCIKIADKSGLFVTDNFNVTHNTTLLTNLITKRILTGELEPDKLVATTFSLDGANEMNSRLEVMFDRYGISWAKKYVKIKTIHALCLQILKELNIPCNVITGLERYKMLLSALEMAGVKLEKEDIDELDSILGYQINRMMNDHDVVTSARYSLEDIDEPTYTSIRKCYALLKQQNGVIDYEDMLFQTYYQLYASGRADIRQYFQNKWKYFYIDEAQDTSLIQYRIMQALISDPNKIMMIGDDDQAIYSWRGASPEVLLNVCCDYNIKKLYLSTNYRCKENMVKFSAMGVKNNLVREKKEMLAYNKGGEIIFKQTKASLYDCSCSVAKLIKDMHDNDGIDYEDICVLARYNQDLSILNSVLFNNGIYTHIPKEAQITYGKLFKDFKGLIDFMCGDCWFLDSNSIILNGWKVVSYLNRKTAKIISNGMKSTGYDFITMIQCIQDDKCDDAVGYGIRSTLKFETKIDMAKILEMLHNPNNSKEEKAIEFLFHYTRLALWRFKGARSERLLKSTYQLFRDMIQTYGLEETRKMIKNIELYEKGQITSIGSCVNLSTCHRSKGREWPVVILLADDNYSFPSLNDIQACLENGVSKSEVYSWIEEERRLHYVAKTRAKDKLILAYDKDNLSLFTRECLGEEYSNEDIVNFAFRDAGLPNVDDEKLKKVGKIIYEE